jgi:hypothetical protein
MRINIELWYFLYVYFSVHSLWTLAMVDFEMISNFKQSPRSWYLSCLKQKINIKIYKKNSIQLYFVSFCPNSEKEEVLSYQSFICYWLFRGLQKKSKSLPLHLLRQKFVKCINFKDCYKSAFTWIYRSFSSLPLFCCTGDHRALVVHTTADSGATVRNRACGKKRVRFWYYFVKCYLRSLPVVHVWGTAALVPYTEG